MRNKHTSQPQINSTEESSPTKSFRFARPNYTQTPNEFYDEIQKTLKTRGEILVLGTIIRQTIGWGNKEWDRISISQMMAKTGLHRQAVIAATKKLIKQGLIIKHKTGTNGVHLCWYKLNIEPSEFENNDDFSSQNEIQSKILYQCDHHTPTSVIITPTKETKTKEKEKVGIGNDPPPAPTSSLENNEIARNELSEKERSYLRESMSADEVIKYVANAITHRLKCPKSKYNKKTLCDTAREFWQQDQDKKRVSKKVAEADREKTSREYLQKIKKENPRAVKHIIEENSYVSLGKPGGVTVDLFFNAHDFIERLTKILPHLGKKHVWADNRMTEVWDD